MYKKTDTYVAIMAGGIGSRFWPVSRTNRPKQFLDILGVGKSLIRLTFERFLKLCPPENIFIVTNHLYKDLIKEHLPELTDNQILCEPSRNNTGPCVAYASFKLHSLNPNANFVVAPSDHIILKEEAFIEKLKKGLGFTATNNALLTLGITPTRPDTGYGYIEFDKSENKEIKKVSQFKEKPDKDTTNQFLESGNYLWNAGIFIWSAQSILKSFRDNASEIYEILKKGDGIYNSEKEQDFIDTQYPTTPSISVDYAILERSNNVFTMPADIGWSDLGTWGSLHEGSEKDSNNNAIQGEHVIAMETKDSLIRMPKNKLLACKGLSNYIIVDEEDALLIWPKNSEQEIKALTAMVKGDTGGKYL